MCTFRNGCFSILHCCHVFLYIFFFYIGIFAFLNVSDLWLDFGGVLNKEPFKVYVGFERHSER